MQNLFANNKFSLNVSSKAETIPGGGRGANSFFYINLLNTKLAVKSILLKLED